MTAVISQFLEPKIVAERISRYRLRNRGLQTILGMQPGGANAGRIAPSRTFNVDVYSDTNRVAPATRPEQRSVSLSRIPVGGYTVTVPHTSLNVSCGLERLNNQRPIGGPVSTIDELGRQYLSSQEQSLTQQLANIREFQCAAMLRGSYTYTQSGDALFHDFSGGSVTVDFQIPSGNKSQLNMLGGGDIVGTTWSNASTDIPTDISQINAAFQELTGTPLSDMIITSVMWENIKNNTAVKAQAGTSNPPFMDLGMDPVTGLIKTRIACHPWLNIWIYDQTLAVGSSYTATKLIADTAAVFIANFDGNFAYYDYASPVVERPGAMPTNVLGDYQWAYYEHDPASVVLRAKGDGIPALHVPKSIAYGTVVF